MDRQSEIIYEDYTHETNKLKNNNKGLKLLFITKQETLGNFSN